MQKGYWIVRIKVTDEKRYALIAAHCAEVIDRVGGNILVRARDGVTPTGLSNGRTIVVEFPNYAEAQEQFEDPQNRSATELMRQCAEIDIVIVPGVADEMTDTADQALNRASGLAPLQL